MTRTIDEWVAIRFEVLADKRGVYGYSLIDPDHAQGWDDSRVLLRPDKVSGAGRAIDNIVALQSIPPKLGGVFRDTRERWAAKHLLTAMLARAGIERYPSDDGWWANTRTERDKNRRLYHGLKRRAWAITNYVVRQALANAPQDAIRAARRFPLASRYAAYREIARGPRFLQLVDTFPAALVAICGTDGDEYQEAVQLVERGARLKVLADFLGLPMAMRRIKPGAVGRHCQMRNVASIDIGNLIYAYLPATTAAQRRWLRAVGAAAQMVGGPYVELVARYADDLGDTIQQVRASVQDVGDWVRASYLADTPAHIIRAVQGDQFHPDDLYSTSRHITRPFSPAMSLRTVRELSAEWHESVALANHDTTVPLPPPWRDAEQVNGWQILPLATAADIAAEGRAMHHCAATLIDSVRNGQSYLYSVEEGGERIATVEVQRHSRGVSIGQMRGPCNAILPKSTQDHLRRWVRQKDRWRLPKAEIFERRPVQAEDTFDDEIPF